MLRKVAGVPLYLQVRDTLLAKIETGVWAVETRIPTESELCVEYAVSKITVREAIRLLVRDGRLYRIPGKGTFTAKPKIETKLDRFFSFTRWALQNGIEPASRLLKVESMTCDQHVARHLRILNGDSVTRLERLRLGNGEPLMLEVVWIPLALCPGLHIHDIANEPLNDILQREYGLSLIRATESIEPQTADSYAAHLLRIEKGTPLLHVEHTTFTITGKVAYFASSSYRGDRVRFSVEVRPA